MISFLFKRQLAMTVMLGVLILLPFKISAQTSSDPNQILAEDRKNDQQECEQEVGGGSGGGGRPAPAAVPAVPPIQKWQGALYAAKPAPAITPTWISRFVGESVQAQTSIYSQNLSSFADLADLIRQLQAESGFEQLIDVLASLRGLGCNLGQLTDSYSTVSDLAQINNLSGINEVFGQLGNLQADFGQILSGTQGAADLFQQLGAFDSGGLTNLTNTLGQIYNLNGSFGGLMESFGSFGGLLDGFANVRDLGGLANAFGQLSNLGGGFDQMLTSFGGFSQMLGGFNNIADLSGLADTFGQLSNLGGGFEQIFSGADGFAGLIGGFANIRNFGDISNVLGQITNLGGNLDQIMGGFTNISEVFGGLAGLDDLSGLSLSLADVGLADMNFDEVLDGFGQGSDFSDMVGELEEGGVTETMEETFPALAEETGLGELTGLTDAVPVHEVGQLLETTKDTNEVTKEIRDLEQQNHDLQMQICMHLKVIRRIAEYQEEKAKINDPDARKAGLLGYVELFTKGIFPRLKSSYARSPGVTGAASSDTSAAASGGANETSATESGYSAIADLEENQNDASQEGVAKGLTEVVANSNPYAKKSAEIIEAALAADPLADYMTQEEVDKMNNPEENSDPQVWWQQQADYALKNPGTALMVSLDKVLAEQSTASLNSTLRFVAYNGINEERECALFNEEGDKCIQWRTLVPGSTKKTLLDAGISQGINAVVNSNQQNADVANKIVPDVLDQAQKINLPKNQTQSSTETETTTTENDPCPSGKPCPDTGWKRTGQITNNALKNIASTNYGNPNFGSRGSANTGGETNNPLGNFDLTDLLDIFPEVAITRFESAQNEDGAQTLSWSAPGAFYCRAENNWEGTKYQANDDLNEAGGGLGLVILDLPADHPELIYNLVCGNWLTGSQDGDELTIPATAQTTP